jgi:hypothetical protein
MVWHNHHIDLPQSLASLVHVVAEGAKGTQSHYCHWQIIEWCAAFSVNPSANNIDDPIVRIADDIVVQWELYVSTQYTLEQLDRFTPADLVLPRGFFQNWQQQLIKVTAP